MQTSSEFSKWRKPIFSIQGNWQERSSFQKDVKKQVLYLHSEYLFSSICNTTFVGKHLDVFFQSSQLGNLDTFMVNIILIFLGQMIKVDFHHEKMSLGTSVRLLSPAEYYLLPYHYALSILNQWFFVSLTMGSFELSISFSKICFL